MTTLRQAAQQALEALEICEQDGYIPVRLTRDAITALREALEQLVVEPANGNIRDAFERYWVTTRGDKKAARELQRHPLQPQTYVQDSANRHWVTWQSAQQALEQPEQQAETVQQRFVDAFKPERDLTQVLIQEAGGKLFLNGEEIGPGTIDVSLDGLTYRASERVEVKPESECEACYGTGKTTVYGMEESWEENCLYCNGIGIAHKENT
jgi:hypothetical protein